MLDYYISFGWGTTHDIGYVILNRDVLLKIKGYNYNEVKKLAMRMFGNEWSNVYTEENYPGICGYYKKVFILDGYKLLYI